MSKAELFDIVELIVYHPEIQLPIGARGAIVECYENNNYEVEFTNKDGETVALCTLSSEQFIVVWKAKTKSWLSVTEQINLAIARLPEEDQQQVLDFALSLYQR
jgi:hypothetical protein